MRVISKTRLKEFWEEYPAAEIGLVHWYNKITDRGKVYQKPSDIIKEFSEYMIKKPAFKTTIDIRYCIGGENLNSQRVSLFGIKPKEVIEILTKKLS